MGFPKFVSHSFIQKRLRHLTICLLCWKEEEVIKYFKLKLSDNADTFETSPEGIPAHLSSSLTVTWLLPCTACPQVVGWTATPAKPPGSVSSENEHSPTALSPGVVGIGGSHWVALAACLPHACLLLHGWVPGQSWTLHELTTLPGACSGLRLTHGLPKTSHKSLQKFQAKGTLLWSLPAS